jgi:ribose 5-phosphate isomerase B
MKVFIGADHNGFEFKQTLTDFLRAQGHEVIDAGDQQLDPSDDFPQFAHATIDAFRAQDDPAAKAILICGSGQGMVMAANRYKGIRACLAWNESSARASRTDDDSNVLCLPARELASADAVNAITQTWLNTDFAGDERFVRRIQQLDELG